MKNFKLILIIIFLTVYNAYTQDLKKGDYVPNENNKNFVGSWRYIKNGDTLEIILIEKKRVLLDLVGVYTDILEGKISYKRIGKIPVISKNNGFIINNGMASKNETNRMGAFLLDPNGKSASIRFEILKNGNLKYQVEQAEGIRIKGQKDRRSLRIPTMLTLVKI